VANTAQDKLSLLLKTKNNIKKVIKAKGIEIDDTLPFSQYVELIKKLDDLNIFITKTIEELEELGTMEIGALAIVYDTEIDNLVGLYEYFEDGWRLAPTQLTATAKDIAPGYIGYGQNGVEVGNFTLDATAMTVDIIAPKIAYVKGQKIIGNISQITETGNSFEQINALSIGGSVRHEHIYDYDYINKLYVGIYGGKLVIGTFTDNIINAPTKTFNPTDLISGVAGCDITCAKFSRVTSESAEYIKLFVTVQSIVTLGGNVNGRNTNHLLLLKLNRNTLNVIEKKSTSYTQFFDSPSTDFFMLAVHPKKDMALGFYIGTNNGSKLCYIGVYYDENNNTMSTKLSGVKGIGSWDYTPIRTRNHTRSYCTESGHVCFWFGSTSNVYSFTFTFNSNNTITFVGLDTSAIKYYLNNGSYIYKNILYNSNGTQLTNCVLDDLNKYSTVVLIGNNIIYGNKLNNELNKISVYNIVNSTITKFNFAIYDMSYKIITSNYKLFVAPYDSSRVDIYTSGEVILKGLIRANIPFLRSSLTSANAEDLLYGKTALSKDSEIIGTMSNNGSLNYIPSKNAQSIPKGYTSGGTIAAVNSSVDPNIIAENIKEGVEILGVTGTLTQIQEVENILKMENSVISIEDNTLVIEETEGVEV